MARGLSKSKKKLVRRLMVVRGDNYTTALAELRELPEDASWTVYVERVEKQAGHQKPGHWIDRGPQ